MRVDLKKALFIGPANLKDAFFKKAQSLGLIDFIEKKGKKEIHFSPEVLAIVQAIKTLRTLNPTKQYTNVSMDKAQEAVARINEAHKQLEELLSDQHQLKEKLEEVAPFGSFSLERVKRLEKESGLHVKFFAIKKTTPLEVPKPVSVFKAGMSEDFDYYFAIGKIPFTSPKIIEIEVSESKDDIENHLEKIHEKIVSLEHELKECSHYNQAVHKLFLDQLNVDHLTQALDKAAALLDDTVFVVAGWVPVNKWSHIAKFCKEEGVIFNEIQVESRETVPTHLENEGWNRIGEDLVHIYDTPSNTDKDPSLWVLFFFALFFAIIVGDAGYGLVYLLLCGYIWWKFPNLKGLKRRTLSLSTFLSIACVIWGILAGSYFGMSIERSNPLKKYSLINYLVEKKAAYHINAQDDVWKNWVTKFPQLKDVKDPSAFLDEAVVNKPEGKAFEVTDRFTDNIMLELALFIGVLHLCLSMARYALRQWALIGWIIFMIGAYLWVTSHFNYTSLVNFMFGISKAASGSVGKDLSIVGLIVAVVCAFIQEKLYGVLEITKLISILADTLSYLRLYALGMAGGILAATINKFAGSMPFVVGLILAFIAHTFNMGLAIMGGVIHGLRLNFIEWYHYSFFGGGKQFKPLKILTKDE